MDGRIEISMDKKWIICIIITVIIGLILGISIAFITQKENDETEGTDFTEEKELASANEQLVSNGVKNANVIETSAQENTISPNAIIIKKTYYESCDHLIRKVEDIPEKLVNKTQQDIELEYPDWEIEEYTPTQITLYKSATGNCGEHYFVQEHNGVIGIYTVDEYGVKKLKEDTEISTQYLPETDVKNLKAGVEIIGHTKLIEFLEDYE